MFMALAAEATVMLYDGSPFARDAMMLFDYAQKERSRTSAPRRSSSTRWRSAACGPWTRTTCRACA
jgi:hypothetical protein